MMLFKLSARNLKKSIQNYVVYFVTLIIGVAIFYVFNSIEGQSVMLNVSEYTLEIIDMMVEALSVVSVFVSFVLGFLIVYASSFLMKRRKKEFGIYMLLGMNKRKIAAVMVIETVMIGIISLAIGLLVGIVGSWGMSVIVANMFESDMTDFSFVISPEAMVKTFIYFTVMYFIVIALDTFVVGKARVINLLNAGKQSEKNTAKNPILCLIVFAIASVLLGTAYYNVTAGVTEISSLKRIGIEIIKGIIGTFLLFWSVAGILVIIAKKNKRAYFKGLNCFTTKELSSRINTSVFSGGIICLLIFFTICIFSSSVAVRNAQNATLRDCVKTDIMFRTATFREKSDFTIEEVLDTYGVEIDDLKDITDVRKYDDENILGFGDLMTDEDFDELSKTLGSGFISYLQESSIEVMNQSDYNRLAELFGLDKIDLGENHYAISANYKYFIDVYKNILKRGTEIKIGKTVLTPKNDKLIEGPIEITNAYENMGVVIVPDTIDVSKFEVVESLMFANYDGNSKEEKEKIGDYFEKSYHEFQDKYYQNLKNDEETVESDSVYDDFYEDEAPYISFDTRKMYYDSSKGLTTMIVFIGSYLGIVFMISSGAILSLKELSGAVDNKEKYTILRKLGVDEKMISHSLFKQCITFFGIPLIIAIIHSVFGIQTAMFILEAFGRDGLFTAIMLSAVVILGVYGIYFILTYFCSKKIIEE